MHDVAFSKLPLYLRTERPRDEIKHENNLREVGTLECSKWPESQQYDFHENCIVAMFQQPGGLEVPPEH